jgi:hypothetical protein
VTAADLESLEVSREKGELTMQRHLFRSASMRSRWAAIGAAVAVSLGAGGLAFVEAAASSEPALFHAMAPVRVFDTRDGTGGVPVAPLGPGATLDVTMGGVNGVPADATAVVLNVTVVNGTAPSFLTVFPTGDPRPTASSMNWTTGEATPNGVIASLGAGGKVSFYNLAGTVDVLADVAGYFTAADTPPFTPVVAQTNGSSGLGGTLASIASVALTLPDVCPGAPDSWTVLVQADGYFLTGGGGSGSATVALGLTSTVFTSGTVVNQNFNSTGQFRESYSTAFLFTVDAGTQTFHELGSTDHPNGVTAAQNNLIAQSVSVTC